MAQKSFLLSGLVLAIVLFICQDVAYARELTEANDISETKTTIDARRPGLNNENLFGGFPGGPRNTFGFQFGGFGQPGIGAGFGSGFPPRFGSGGFPPRFGSGGFPPGFGSGGFPPGFGRGFQPGFGGQGFGGFGQPYFGGGGFGGQGLGGGQGFFGGGI